MKRSKIRVFFLDPDGYSLPYDNALANELLNADVELEVVTPRPVAGQNPPFYFYPFSRHLKPNLFKKLLKFFEHICSMLRLCFLANRAKPHVIHFQWLMLPSVDWLFLAYLRKRFCLIHTVHNFRAFHGDRQFWLQGLNYRRTLNFFHGLIVHTESSKRELDRARICGRVVRIHHGPLREKLFRTDSLDSSRSHHLLFLGRVRPYKGVDTFLKALILLHRSTEVPWRATIAGEFELKGRDNSNFESLIRQIPKITVIKKYLNDSEINQLILSASLAVFPYREVDASGVFSILINAGVPTFCSRVGVFEETLAASCPELLFEVDNEFELASKLKAFLENPEASRLFSQRLSQVADAIPGWAEIAMTHRSFYETCLEG